MKEEIKEEIFDKYEKQVDMEERKQIHLDKSINPKDYKEAMEYVTCVSTQSHLKECKKCRDRAYLLFPSDKEDLGDKIKNVLDSN